MAGFSAGFIPALTVSTRTPVEIVGEYGDTRLAKGGRGSGGMGSRRPPICLGCVAVGDFDLVAAGCFPLADVAALVLGLDCTLESGGNVLYGCFGTLSGLSICI